METSEKKPNPFLRAYLSVKTAFCRLSTGKRVLVGVAVGFAFAALVAIIVLLSASGKKRQTSAGPEPELPAAAETGETEPEPTRAVISIAEPTEPPTEPTEPPTEPPETEPPTEPPTEAPTETEPVETEPPPDLTVFYGEIEDIFLAFEQCEAQKQNYNIKTDNSSRSYFSGDSLVILEQYADMTGYGESSDREALSNCNRCYYCKDGDVYFVVLRNQVTGDVFRLYFSEGLLLRWTETDGTPHDSDGERWMELQQLGNDGALRCAEAQEDWNRNVRLARMYTQYASITEKYTEQYGKCATENLMPYSAMGLCLAELIDLDNNGTDELIVVYASRGSYTMEVWGLKGDTVTKLWATDNFDAVEARFTKDYPVVLAMREKNGRTYFLSSSFTVGTIYSTVRRISWLENGSFTTLTLETKGISDIFAGSAYIETLNGVQVTDRENNAEYKLINDCFENYTKTYVLRDCDPSFVNPYVSAVRQSYADVYQGTVKELSKWTEGYVFVN